LGPTRYRAVVLTSWARDLSFILTRFQSGENEMKKLYGEVNRFFLDRRWYSSDE
jgi:hypothetical protein